MLSRESIHCNIYCFVEGNDHAYSVPKIGGFFRRNAIEKKKGRLKLISSSFVDQPSQKTVFAIQLVSKQYSNP